MVVLHSNVMIMQGGAAPGAGHSARDQNWSNQSTFEQGQQGAT
jgi:hypothetical protein